MWKRVWFEVYIRSLIMFSYYRENLRKSWQVENKRVNTMRIGKRKMRGTKMTRVCQYFKWLSGRNINIHFKKKNRLGVRRVLMHGSLACTVVNKWVLLRWVCLLSSYTPSLWPPQVCHGNVPQTYPEIDLRRNCQV